MKSFLKHLWANISPRPSLLALGLFIVATVLFLSGENAVAVDLADFADPNFWIGTVVLSFVSFLLAFDALNKIDWLRKNRVLRAVFSFLIGVSLTTAFKIGLDFASFSWTDWIKLIVALLASPVLFFIVALRHYLRYESKGKLDKFDIRNVHSLRSKIESISQERKAKAISILKDLSSDPDLLDDISFIMQEYPKGILEAVLAEENQITQR